MSEIKLNNEPAYEYNDQQRLVKVGEISGKAKIIRKKGVYTLVKLELNGNYYLVK